MSRPAGRRATARRLLAGLAQGATIMRASQPSGFTVLEMLITVFVVGFVAILGIPPMLNWTAGLQVQLAAAEISTCMHKARYRAIQHSQNVAVKFRTGADGVVTFALYRDGDMDGVRNNDIVRGVDPEIQAPRPVAFLSRRVRFGFPEGDAPREPGGSGERLDRLEDPIRFNNSDLASFSPLGTATPGTVYLTDGKRHLAAVRVLHRSAKISVLSYEPSSETWR